MNTFPRKHVTLIHSGTALVSKSFGARFCDKVRNKLEQSFKVRIVLGTLTKVIAGIFVFAYKYLSVVLAPSSLVIIKLFQVRVYQILIALQLENISNRL